jgi:hypothetical protein
MESKPCAERFFGSGMYSEFDVLVLWKLKTQNDVLNSNSLVDVWLDLDLRY